MITIYHAVEPSTPKDARIARAEKSWKELYDAGQMRAAHLHGPAVTAHRIGDRRNLPLLRDVLARGLRGTLATDIVVLTNGDTLLHPLLPALLLATLAHQPAVSSFRLNADRVVELNKAPATLVGWFPHDYGRDMFAFKASWLRENWQHVPNAFMGELEWDLCMALLIRNEMRVETPTTTSLHELTRAELPLGYVLHERHKSVWQSIGWNTSAKLWNKAMARAWYEDHQLERLFTLGA